MVVAAHSVDPGDCRELFDEPVYLVASRFRRVEPRRAADGREFVLGRLSPAERKSCWQAGGTDKIS